jgi:LacI family transcriptional regulator
MTIKDIARIAGVTHSTVSRSLNDSPLVSAETKAKIRRIAEEQGYRPNTHARKLVSGRSKTLGVFFLSRAEISLSENFGTQFLEGIARESQNHDYDLLFFTHTREAITSPSYLELCRDKNVEGAIFIGMNSEDPHINELQNAEFPLCMIDFPIQGKKVGYVTTDTDQGISIALDYLKSMGHRKIGFITGPKDAPIAMERFDAFKRIMDQEGHFRQDWVWEGNFSTESGYQIGKSLKDITDLPTAILSSNDIMALGLLKAVKELGWNLPEDISIMGYDNALPSQFSHPGLTTIGQNAIEMGSLAAQYVFTLLKRKTGSKVTKTTPELVIRDSVQKI